jgi:formate dehydrogenase iron-sulfur subunit
VSVSRRSFLKLGAAASGTLALSARASEGDVAAVVDGFGVLVDTTYCIGCRRCEWGCNQANDLPKRERLSYEDKTVFKEHRRPVDTAYTVVNQVGVTPESGAALYAKAQCMHCLSPACASACIVGALQKTPEGPVIYDAWKCMGCRYCIVACPFQIPAYEYSNALTPKVQKCSFCYERIVKESKRPACVENCPNEALTFGKRSELRKLARMKMEGHPSRYNDHIYGEFEAGGTSWMYLAKVDFETVDLPPLDNKPIPQLTETIQHAVFKGFVPPVALYGLLGLLMWSRRREETQEPETDHE